MKINNILKLTCRNTVKSILAIALIAIFALTMYIAINNSTQIVLLP